MERQPTDLKQGLTPEQVLERTAKGLSNGKEEITTKTVPQILRDNIVTPFNLLNLILAVLVLLTGSWKNCLFMGVIVCNILIGTVQEIRAKRIIDRLSLIAAPKAHVLRGGHTVEIPLSELVLDDLMVLSAGSQVCADAEVVEGSCEVNESLLTGESDPVLKKTGDQLLSGSFVVSGRCKAQAVRVGAESYAAKITRSAKYLKRPDSEIMSGINKLIRYIGLTLIPVGAALFIKAVFFSGDDVSAAVVGTVAALIGMIPEGLVLLISVILAVSVIRLSRRGALVQELFSIEMLSRVDVLCLDKTGTITQGAMQVDQVVPLGAESVETLRAAAAAVVAATGDENPTAAAVGELCPASGWHAAAAVPFSSARKWSGASFPHRGTWVLGAGEFVLGADYAAILPRCREAAERGERVLVLAVSEEPFSLQDGLPPGLRAAGLLFLSDKIRPGAQETLAYFTSQGVELKVISGDDPVTVSSVARRVGLPGAERWVDAATLKSEEDIRAAAGRYAVFGRVTPAQKLSLVKALKEAGHTVAMTGDGVNDVMALRESDCSVAMAAGSDAARNVSQIVLMDSDFSAMPHIVAEGRRSINNLQRSASLFLTKTTFSTILAICFMFLTASYPFQPIQLTLISTLTIGIPSFFLALEPNRERLRGRFLVNVMERALPGGITMASNVLLLTALSSWLGFSPAQFSTLSVLLTGYTGLLNLWRISRPFDCWRMILFLVVSAGFAGGYLLLPKFFSLTWLTGPMALALLALAIWAAALMALLPRVVERVARYLADKGVLEEKRKN